MKVSMDFNGENMSVLPTEAKSIVSMFMPVDINED